MTLNAVDAKLKNCATGRLTDPYAPEKAREILNRRIAEIKDHPALLGWYIGVSLVRLDVRLPPVTKP